GRGHGGGRRDSHGRGRRPSSVDDAGQHRLDEPRVLRGAVQLRADADRGQPDLPAAGRRGARPSDPEHRGPDHRSADPAVHRRHERQDVGPEMGTAQALRHRRQRADGDHPPALPAGQRAVDGRRLPLAGGRRQQHRHGALPGADLRSAAQDPDPPRLPDPEPVHRRRCRPGQRVAVHHAAGHHRGDRRRRPLLGVRRLLVRRRQRRGDDHARDAAHPRDRAEPGGARAHPVAVQGACRDDQGDRRRREGHADRHAQDRAGLHVPVVRDVHLLAVRERQRRRVGLQRAPGDAGLRGGGRLDRPDERLLQLRHHAVRAVPAAPGPAHRRQARARRQPRDSRDLPDRPVADRGQDPHAAPDDRPRHLLGQHGRRALPDGGEHGPPRAHRRVHGDPEHDDRGPDADPDGHVRLDLPELPGRPGHQRDDHGRRPPRVRGAGDAVGQLPAAGRGLLRHAARRPSGDHRVRPRHRRLRRLGLRAVRRGAGARDRVGGRGPRRRGGGLRARRRARCARGGGRPQAAGRRARGARGDAKVRGGAHLGPHPGCRADRGRGEARRGPAPGGRREQGDADRRGQPRARGEAGRGPRVGARRDRAQRGVRRDGHPDAGGRRGLGARAVRRRGEAM
ncbi:MAG: Uncharacterized MFS-type transporter, partial [uncultured Solirubrobacteraceae bacterium]